jgi:hypothetical protein
MRLDAIAFECGLSKSKTPALLSIRDDPAKPLFDKGLKGGSLSMGYLACLFKEAIGYLYGCLHISIYIARYAKMARII